jgi:hypothetical protein
MFYSDRLLVTSVVGSVVLLSALLCGEPVIRTFSSVVSETGASIGQSCIHTRAPFVVFPRQDLAHVL